MSEQYVDTKHGEIEYGTTTCHTCHAERVEDDVFELTGDFSNGHAGQYEVCRYCLNTETEPNGVWLGDALPLIGVAFTVGVVLSTLTQLFLPQLLGTISGITIFAVCFSAVYLFTHQGDYSWL